MIRAIIFDCFGVLYIDPSKSFYEQHVPNYHKIFELLKDIDRQHDYGFISKREHNQQVAELSGLAVEFINAHIDDEHKRNDQLLDSIKELRKTYKIGMLSNINPGGMDTFFTTREREELFDAVVLSGEVGLTKPHPYIFQMMADRLGVSPGECVMIDDLEENCAGADAAGMETIHYLNNTQVLADLKKLLSQS